MIITTQINMDLIRAEKTPTVRLVCDDKLSRAVQLNLFADGEAVALPAGCTALVRYGKPDGTGGSYDTLPDGSKAWSIEGNAVTVALAPQVCNVPGKVKLTVTLLDGEKELNCFTVYLDVQGHVGEPEESEDYIYITGYLPQPGAAAVGQYLQVSGVDAKGRVTAVKAAEVETANAEAVPEYVRSEAQRLAALAQSRQNGGTLSLLCCSDLHYSGVHVYAAQMGESVLHAGQGMGIVSRQMHLDGAAMLGDLVWDGGEAAFEALEAMRFANEAIADAFTGLPNFRTRGNHEGAYKADTALTDAQIFANVAAYNDGAVVGDRLGGWCYRDYADRKIRVVCINTSESSDGSMAVSAAQNSWLQSALAVESGWATVLLSHHPLDWSGSGSNVMRTVAAASNVLCNIHGHTHCYAVDALAGTKIPRIAVPNVCFYRNNEYGQNGGAENAEGIEFGEETTYAKTAKSAEDTAFCVITIDREAGKIYADHYGAGYDRVVLIGDTQAEVFTVSNVLENVTNGNGVAQVQEGMAYHAVLTAAEGHTISSVVVTMGGVNVTASVYSDGNIHIPSVSGDIVITASAQLPSDHYTNLVPSALDYDLEGVFGENGYRNGYYVSTAAPYYTATTDGSVATGLIPYDIYGGVNGYGFQPATIYIKGITFDASNSHNRLGVFVTEGEIGTGGTSAKFIYATVNAANLSTYFSVETLGDKYYKLTPLMVAETGRNKLASTWISTINVSHIAISGNGSGENLIVTFDEPIE